MMMGVTIVAKTFVSISTVHVHLSNMEGNYSDKSQFSLKGKYAKEVLSICLM